jgi:hypothetical protein
LLFVFPAYAQFNVSDISLDDIKSRLPDGVTFPPEIEGLPIPSIENATRLFKEKCVKESGSDAAYEEASVRSWIFCSNSVQTFTFYSKPQQILWNVLNGS